MTKMKAQQIGALGTFIFAAIGSLPLFYLVASNIDFFTSEVLGQQTTLQFFDLYVPILIILSLKFGRKLGERIFIEREQEVVYYTGQTILNTAGLSILFTLGLFRVYFLFIEQMEKGEMEGIGGFFEYLIHLFEDLVLIAFSGIFIYVVLIIPCSVASLCCGLIFKWLRK